MATEWLEVALKHQKLDILKKIQLNPEEIMDFFLVKRKLWTMPWHKAEAIDKFEVL